MLFTNNKAASPPTCKNELKLAIAKLDAVCNDALDIIFQYKEKAGLNDNPENTISAR